MGRPGSRLEFQVKAGKRDVLQTDVRVCNLSTAARFHACAASAAQFSLKLNACPADTNVRLVSNGVDPGVNERAGESARGAGICAGMLRFGRPRYGAIRG